MLRALISLFLLLILNCNCSLAIEIDGEEGLDLFIGEVYEIEDPFEEVNRVIFNFNIALNRNIFSPLAKSYTAIKSNLLSEMINDFSNNLYEPSNFINGILQGRIEFAMRAFWRFYINSILGLGGLFDVAELLGIHGDRLNFEDSMVFYGINPGPYVVLPFSTPSSVRGSVAFIFEFIVNPLFYMFGNVFISAALYLGLLIPQRAEIIDVQFDAGVDPYARWRSFFSQKMSYENF